MRLRAKRNISLATLFIFLGLMAAVIVSPLWTIYVEWMLNLVGRRIYSPNLPSVINVILGSVIVMLPVLAISTLSGLLARPYIRPGTEEITATYIDDLDLALKNITEAQDYFGKMRASFESLSVSKKEIEAELVELKEARSIEKKTLHRRMRIYKEKSFWLRLLTYLATFVSGVGASLAASYIKEYLQNVP